MQDLTRYVNPYVGSVGHLLSATSPAVYYPHGMMQMCPAFTPGIGDRYLADKIYSFPAGAFSFMPTRQSASAVRDDSAEAYCSLFDHDLELAAPHKYEVYLETSGIQVISSVHKHSVIFEFDFGDEGGDVVVYTNQTSRFDGASFSTKGKYLGVDAFSYACFSQCPQTRIISEFAGSDNTRQCVISAHFPEGGKVRMKAGVSFIDFDQAKRNLDSEISGFDLEGTIEKAAEVWNGELGKIRVEGDEEKKKILYTAIYRSSLRPYCLSEYGRYYSGYDNQVHFDDGHEFYCGDGLWDTFRCMHPLHILLDKKMQEDVLESYIRMYEQSGVLPNFPYPDRDKTCMIGFHSASLFADALCKGVPFDVGRAYAGVRKNAFERTMMPWVSAPKNELDDVYYEMGFFPALAPDEAEWVKGVHPFEGRQAVAVTLEHSYSDWCAMMLARELGEEADEAVLKKRSRNYRNVFHHSTKFMAPRTEQGDFIAGFNPKLSGGQGGRRYFAENNSWTYSYSVFHDVEDLIALFGGREGFLARLDQLFVEGLGTSKYDFLKQFPDSTGLIGQFSMGNEPSFHIPYLYALAGEPHKAQRKIHEIAYMWFHNHPLGICGDEDGGAMSSWYVFAAMGFYPVCPGKAEYVIGSPLFDKIELTTDEGVLTICADGASGKAKYIKSAKLNGQALEGVVLSHEDVMSGGTIEFEMAEKI